MDTSLFRIITLIAFLITCVIKTSGQIQPGETIEIDTITFKPKKAFPFDQAFVLKLEIKGKVDPEFAVIYTLDKYGEKREIRKKDYQNHIRKLAGSGDNRIDMLRKRKDKRKKDPYSGYKIGSKSFSQYFIQKKDIKTSYKDKVTSIYAVIPPLEPGRNYQFIPVLKDTGIIDKTSDFANYYFYSLNAATADDKDKSNELMIDTYYDIVNKKSTEVVSFTPSNINRVKDLVQDTLVTFDARKYAGASEFRFFLVKDTSNPNAASLQSITQNNRFTTSTKATNTKVPLPYRDYEGNAITQNTSYKIYVLIKMGSAYSLSEPSRKFEFDNNAINDLEPTKFVGVDNSIGVNYRIFDKLQISKNLKDSIRDTTVSLDNLATDKAKTCLQFLLTSLIECNCEDKILAEILFKEEQDVFEGIRTFLQIGDITVANRAKLLKGEIRFSGDKSDASTTTKINSLKESIASVNIAMGAIDYLHTDSITCLKDLRTYLKALKDDFQNNLEKYQEIRKNQALIKNEISNAIHFDYVPSKVTNSSTVSASLKSRGQLRIVPDFGLIGVFKGNGSVNFSDLVPYVGLQVNFRPINKNVRFKSIKNKTLWHRMSFMTGLTTTSIAIPNQREDLFGSNSLLTGLGFRLNNTLRITGGMVWFKRFSENPLSNRKTLSFSPSVGISIDVEFLEIIGGVKKIFTL